MARCKSLHNNYQIEDALGLSYEVGEKIYINDRTCISKFLSHIIKISCQSTGIIRSTYFLPFLFSFCSYVVVIFDE